MDCITAAALIIFLFNFLAALDVCLGLARMKRLSAHDPKIGDYRTKRPMVSLIVPACNEEDGIDAALRSQLQQDYAHLEIVAVNDRSSDNTAVILEKLRQQDSRLQVLHIDELPAGWLGKAHALQRGAEMAAGEYLLFTDGDIIMEKTTVSRAVGYMESEGLDHLCLVFKNISSGLLLNSLILESGAALLQIFRPWRLRRKGSRRFIGVGAFNMVRKEVYERIGGHRRIPMHPVDDIMLGKIIKRSGYRQDCLLGIDLVRLRWYESTGQMVRGLMKNAMALMNFRYLLLPPVLLMLVTFNILPLWGAVFSQDAARLFFAGAVVVRTGVSYAGTRLLGISPLCAAGVLVTPYISVYILLRAAWRNYRDGGIYWRGTHYALDELRRNEPLLP